MADPDDSRTLLSAAGYTDVTIRGVTEGMSFGSDPDEAYDFTLGLLGWMLDGLDSVGQDRGSPRPPLHHRIPRRDRGRHLRLSSMARDRDPRRRVRRLKSRPRHTGAVHVTDQVAWPVRSVRGENAPQESERPWKKQRRWQR